MKDIGSLRQLEYPTSPSVLEYVETIMSKIRPADHSLVDLYSNKGKADPFIIACALDGQGSSKSSLFPERWRVASNDKAVIDMAHLCNVETLSNSELKYFLETNQ